MPSFFAYTSRPIHAQIQYVRRVDCVRLGARAVYTDDEKRIDELIASDLELMQVNVASVEVQVNRPANESQALYQQSA